MISLEVAYAASKNPTLLNRLSVAIVRAAISVYTEGSETPNLQKRKNLVASVVKDPEGNARYFAFAILALNLLSIEDEVADGTTVDQLVAAVSDRKLYQDALRVWNLLA